MTIKKVVTQNTASIAESYIGRLGELFFDPTFSVLRISDAITPGGNIIGGGSSSSADIGDFIFVHNRMYGANTNGAVLNQINLVPDQSLEASNQYIVIEPTNNQNNTHIHIRAGGDIDQSLAEIVLGGEKTNVAVNDSSKNVIITTTDPQAQTIYATVFDTFGGVTFPGRVIGSNVELSETNNIDLSKQINKLEAGVGQTNYNLYDGAEGQILYLVAANMLPAATAIVVSISNARYIANGIITEGTNILWYPFHYPANNADVNGGPTMVTLIFANGFWCLPHSYVD